MDQEKILDVVEALQVLESPLKLITDAASKLSLEKRKKAVLTFRLDSIRNMSEYLHRNYDILQNIIDLKELEATGPPDDVDKKMNEIIGKIYEREFPLT